MDALELPRSSKNRTYKSWEHFRQRCTNPKNHKYHRYGGRGITFDPRWNSFVEFVKDMGTRPAGTTLDRINNDSNYCKDNCRWATPTEQNNNRSNSRIYTMHGMTLNLYDWAQFYGVPHSNVYKRLDKGATLEEALFA